MKTEEWKIAEQAMKQQRDGEALDALFASPEPITDHQESVSDSLPPCQKCGLVKNGPYIECGDCKRVLCEDCYTGPPPVVCQDCKGKRP